MHLLRFVSASLCSIVLLVGACGDDKGDTDTAANTTTLTSTTNTTPPAMTDPGPTSDGTTGPTSGPEPDTTDTLPTTTPDPTTTTDPTMTSDPTATTDPTGGDGMFCVDHCVEDADCTQDGLDLGLKCVDTVCKTPPCAGDSACTALFSGWTSCAAQADCTPGQVCIDYGGDTGGCALQEGMGFMCDLVPGFAAVMLPPIEGGEPLTVCGNTAYTCNMDSGLCENPCEDNSECVSPSAPMCNTDTGACECAADTDCETIMSPEYSKCTDKGFCGCGSDADCANSLLGPVCTSAGVCGCGSDADCTGEGGSKCYEGFCGCASGDECTMPSYDGTMQSCE